MLYHLFHWLTESGYKFPGSKLFDFILNIKLNLSVLINEYFLTFLKLCVYNLHLIKIHNIMELLLIVLTHNKIKIYNKNHYFQEVYTFYELR